MTSSSGSFAVVDAAMLASTCGLCSEYQEIRAARDEQLTKSAQEVLSPAPRSRRHSLQLGNVTVSLQGMLL